MANKFKEMGIDVSRWQGHIDFKKVKDAGISFVIIKAGGSDAGFYKDRCFEDNYRLAKNYGLKVGAYYYAGPDFVRTVDGIEDAKRFRHIIAGKEFDYPVYIDVEEQPPLKRTGITDATIAFCEFMESYNYYVGIYASDVSGFVERLETDRLKAFDKWVAKYGTTKPKTKGGVWQYSSKGQIPGINGYVDLDISTIDYSAIIHSKQLNRG